MRTIPRVLLFLVLVGAVSIPACTDGPSQPPDPPRQRLAGGGRESGRDSFVGGADGSGPAHPGFAFPDPAYRPLFYADLDCREDPSHEVIRDSDVWSAWWASASACLPPEFAETPPEVDFSSNAVVAISLERAPTFARGIWVAKVIAEEGGTIVNYMVSSLDEFCIEIAPGPGAPQAASPTIAVLVPELLPEPVEWVRGEIVFGCGGWEVDPTWPITLYYTDAPCDLGANETVIRDRERYQAWLETALSCDQIRWYSPDSPTMPGWEEPGHPGGIGDPPPPESVPSLPPGWFGLGVDFETHAVLILRTDPQTRWGGGIWLDRYDVTPQGTTIEYTAMVPQGDCPIVGEGHALRPTAAIRVPLPLTEPIRWVRRVEPIGCAWGDTPIGDGGVVSPPPPGR